MSTDINVHDLKRAASREGLLRFALTTPALLVVLGVCVLPVLCLFWLSFTNTSGFTLSNYSRVLGSYAYLQVFYSTFFMAATITLVVATLGFPLSYYIAGLPRRSAAICLGIVLIPLWTSVLVRTYAWLVILQRAGLINKLLIGSGIIDHPLQLAYNRSGTVLAMVHIMLPFFVLPAYSAIKAIDKDYIRAAASLGAAPTRSFWTVLFPLALPGVCSGALLVFVYSLGVYITPAILGGGRVITVAMKVEQNASMYSDWGAASSLGLILLLPTLLIYFGIVRLTSRQQRSFEE